MMFSPPRWTSFRLPEIIKVMLPKIQPINPQRIATPFDDPEFTAEPQVQDQRRARCRGNLTPSLSFQFESNKRISARRNPHYSPKRSSLGGFDDRIHWQHVSNLCLEGLGCWVSMRDFHAMVVRLKPLPQKERPTPIARGAANLQSTAH